MQQILVDADNFPRRELAAVLQWLAAAGVPDEDMVVSGRRQALKCVDWPAGAALTEASGWQHADLVLASAYRPDRGLLVIVSGDGDFAHLAGRHAGPVLVVSASPAAALRAVATVLHPATDSADDLSRWLNQGSAAG
ncbi:MAG: hypothetical protein M3P91_02435 [Actinomycetota bacterium]|nr:hypothetical protein [Actinomycetota bacterium]